MKMYEPDACFVIQPGQFVNGLENICQSLQGFIDMNGTLQSNVKGVVQAGNLSLVTTEKDLRQDIAVTISVRHMVMRNLSSYAT
jgi:ketosteroid isomerase-like protein